MVTFVIILLPRLRVPIFFPRKCCHGKLAIITEAYHKPEGCKFVYIREIKKKGHQSKEKHFKM